jgi:nicotinamide mononucleotide transporter
MITLVMLLSDVSRSILSAIQQTSVIEWLIFIFALVYVILAAIENVWCWLFGILSSALSVYLCYAGHLFLESGLQVFYVFIGIYGWYEWLYGAANRPSLKDNKYNEQLRPSKSELHIISFSLLKISYLILIGCVIWIPFGYIAHNYSTQVYPYLDAFITAFSIVATWMTAKKIIQNWIFWLIIDALAIVLYGSRGYYLIALLYAIYTILSIIGYLQWKKRINIS